jgi:hypothetical protein
VPQAEKKASLMQVAKAVFWSFLGIRKRAAHEKDIVQLKPAQVVIAGLIGAALLIVALVLVVKLVISRVG